MSIAIKVKNLKVNYGKYSILDNVNFEIYEGDLVYIFGANGSGKSTLIKTILGLISKSSGEIKIFEKNSSRDIIAQNFGYVPQYNNIDREFPISVEEVIDLECKVSSTKCSTNPKEHLELLGASHLLKKKLDELSGGEFQKVMIARALTSDPKILILDEPINNLDDKSQKDLMNFINLINSKENKTILLISHDYNIAEHGEHRKILYVSEGSVREETEESLIHLKHLNTQHLGHNGHNH